MKPCRNQKYITGNPGGSRWSPDPPERSKDLAEITEVRIDEIYPHPDNPRTDLGDITELTESIKKNGIMQNLTVIPGHYLTDDEWRDLSNRWKAHPDESIRAAMNSKWVDEGYTSLIGHRRLAAAKEAGLETVPCRILTNTDKKQQIMIMLEENMQRNDLTVIEQAQTFQQLTLFGETEASIAEKTGFSRSTVRHRLNIAKLDRDLLHRKQQDSFQLSLTDLYELERIRDVKTRNKILELCKDPGEIKWRVDTEVSRITRETNKADIITLLEGAGIKPIQEKNKNNFLWSGEWEKLAVYDLMEDPPEEIRICPKHGGEIRYYVWDRDVTVKEKREQEKKEKTKAEIEAERISANIKQAKEQIRAMEADREAFLQKVYAGEYKPNLKKLPLIEEALWNCIVGFGAGVYESYLGDALYKGETITPEIRQKIREKPMDIQMLAVAQRASTYRSMMNYGGEYEPGAAETFKEFYAVLSMYGFALTDPEHTALLDGTSELYRKKA